jgi:hypothetical protein
MNHRPQQKNGLDPSKSAWHSDVSRTKRFGGLPRRYVMPIHYVILCHTMSYYVILCHTMSQYVTTFLVTPTHHFNQTMVLHHLVSQLNQRHIVLASASPRRVELLTNNIGLKVRVVPSTFPENLDHALFTPPQCVVLFDWNSVSFGVWRIVITQICWRECTTQGTRGVRKADSAKRTSRSGDWLWHGRCSWQYHSGET